MNTQALHHRTLPANLPLERIAHNPALKEEQKIAAVGQQFEAILLRQVLQEAQKPVVKSRFTMGGTANAIYQDFITNQLADGLSRSGSLGLASSFESELTRQSLKAAHGDTTPTTEPQAHDRHPRIAHQRPA